MYMYIYISIEIRCRHLDCKDRVFFSPHFSSVIEKFKVEEKRREYGIFRFLHFCRDNGYNTCPARMKTLKK